MTSGFRPSAHGCGSKIRTQRGTLLNGNKDHNLPSGALNLTHTHIFSRPCPFFFSSANSTDPALGERLRFGFAWTRSSSAGFGASPAPPRSSARSPGSTSTPPLLKQNPKSAGTRLYQYCFLGTFHVNLGGAQKPLPLGSTMVRAYVALTTVDGAGVRPSTV